MKASVWHFVAATTVLAVALANEPPSGPSGSARADGPAAKPEATDELPPVQLPPYNVKNRPDRSYREVNEAIAHENLLAPCYIFIQDQPGGMQVRLIGAPVEPLAAENMGDRLQARFPIFSVGW